MKIVFKLRKVIDLAKAPYKTKQICGKLIHLQCNEVESLKQHMMNHHGFEMAALRTVFYGICSECKETQK